MDKTIFSIVVYAAMVFFNLLLYFLAYVHVKKNEEVIVERLGKNPRRLTEGVNLIIPFIDKVIKVK